MTDLDPGPFLEWLDRRVLVSLPWVLLGRAWGTTDESAIRRVHRWRNDGLSVPADQVENALNVFGLALADLYEQTPERLPSGRKPPSHKGFPITIPEDVLLEAHRRHLDEGLSLRAMGHEFFDRCGAKSPQALARCFHNAFKQRGWITLSQAEAMALFNRRKAAKLPRCEHIHQAPGRRKGTRCVRHTARPSGRCWHHEQEALTERLSGLQGRAA